MDSIKDIMRGKADELDVDSKKSDLDIIKKELDRLYPDKIRIISLNDNVVHIATKSAPIAANLRFEKHSLMQNVNKILKEPIINIRISIR